MSALRLATLGLQPAGSALAIATLGLFGFAAAQQYTVPMVVTIPAAITVQVADRPLVALSSHADAPYKIAITGAVALVVDDSMLSAEISGPHALYLSDQSITVFVQERPTIAAAESNIIQVKV